MVEHKPQYSLDFVLMYDEGRSVTFTASTDDPWIAWLASQEISHLNSSLVSNRVYDQKKVTVNLYKDGQPFDQSTLAEEIRMWYKESDKK